MRHHNQGSRPGIQHVFHGSQHVDIEVVGGFVQEQHVGLIQQDQQELQSTLLATRQVANLGRQLGGLETQTLQQLPRRHGGAADQIFGAITCDNRRNAVVHDVVQALQALVQPTHQHSFTRLDPARAGLDSAVNQTHKRRFAGAVRSQYSGAFARG